eukprot:5837518-Pyramimonas_sp.AAC.1
MSELGFGDPESRCAVRSFGKAGRVLWQSSVVAVRSVGHVPVADVLQCGDGIASSRKPFILLNSESARTFLEDP